MLDIRNLSVRFGDHLAVDRLSLSLGENEIVTLVGPTGCGKSTSLRVIAGLEPMSAGEIRLGGLHIDRDHPVPPERRRAGLVFQDFALFPHLNVEHNIGFRLKDKAPVDHWLAMLGLEDKRHAMPATLSGGQKQRVALARCLAHAPDLVLLDEPLSNLDAALKESLRWDIRAALKRAGMPALWVTHDQAEALSIGDRVGVLRAGRLEQIATPEQCYAEPATRFVAGFLGEAVFLPARIEGDRVLSALGERPLAAAVDRHRDVELLLRPADISLTPAASGNAKVAWVHYEGETRLHGVQLNDGPLVQVRSHRELHLAVGSAVVARLATRQALSLFPVNASPDDRPLGHTLATPATAAPPRSVSVA